ncbi:YigZ family protein [Brevibacterium sp. p3-SID960]|uniref:YigZ family protein n=1 Tax=Brevibacterium sp. p3-SID960 TaxID=2916063 RepID=UPI0021A5A8DC|nr:YigZ family protein [Brevibacterium sp. p3-SID960]MCT1689929.1 YigZ family protein [Brevibacterium sp. p3-SID960]
MGYQTLRREAHAEIEIKRSRFIARVVPVETEEAARAVIEEQRAAHSKARHHCTAFILDADGRTQRFNDDGEPAGTAGAPILEVLTGHELTYVVAVVTRYFGGTLLGAGGLVRAYGGAVSAALEDAQVVTRTLLTPVTVELNYATAAAAQRQAQQAGWEVIDSDYSASVRHVFAVPADEVEACAAMLADVSAGLAAPEVGDPVYR